MNLIVDGEENIVEYSKLLDILVSDTIERDLQILLPIQTRFVRHAKRKRLPKLSNPKMTSFKT